MHPHPSFEVPRCPHCGLIQFRRATSNCVRCKKALDNGTARTPAHSFTPHNTEHSAQVLAGRIGTAIRNIRKEKNLTQQRLAILMSTGRSYISKLECGSTVPSLRTLERATSALGIDLAELFLRLRRRT
jgi:ribosome-binding protein aMBF1 (putative translation factor)